SSVWNGSRFRRASPCARLRIEATTLDRLPDFFFAIFKDSASGNPLQAPANTAAAGRRIEKELQARGVIARAQCYKSLAEEQPKAYENGDEVVSVADRAGLSKRVARMRPSVVINGGRGRRQDK